MTGVVIGILLLGANAFFVATEFALIAARRSYLEQLANDGDGRATAALRAAKDLSYMLSAAQLGITIASLLLGAIAEPTLAHLLEGPLHDVGLPEGSAHTVGFVIALSIVVFLHMVLGEMVPKNVAISAPDTAALWLARPMLAFCAVFRPIVWMLNESANLLLRLLGITPMDELSEARTGDEIADLLAVSRREGMLEEVGHRLMTGAIRFPVRPATSVMIPRDAVVAVPSTATAAEVEEIALASGHSRIVVHGGDVDDPLGFVHVKDLLGVPAAQRERHLPPRLVRRMLVVPVDRTLQQLLVAMRESRVQVALVVDGQGTTAGLVTLEDVLEALVGDIRDEHDTAPA